MVLPPSTAEELEVVLATKRRRGVSEDPQKVRKAVLELRQRRATAAWKTWYAAQQAAAQAHHARFLQWQWHMERQHAAGLAAAVMAAEQRAAAAERREREAAAQRRDAEEANTAAAAARDAELARLRDAAAAVRAVEAVRDEIGVFSELRAVEALPLRARHENSVEMCGKQFDSDATDGGGGADVCDDGGAEGFHEPDEVFAGAAPDLDDAAAPLYGDDDDVEMEGVVGGGDGVEAPPRERPAVPQAFCSLAEAFADARRRLSADGLLYAKDTAIYVQYLGLDRGTTFSARTAESLGLREYMHRLTRDFGACIKPDAWDASIGGDYEQWCSEKHKASLEVMFSRAERYLRACGCADLAASVEALVDELDWEELKRQEERKHQGRQTPTAPRRRLRPGRRRGRDAARRGAGAPGPSPDVGPTIPGIRGGSHLRDFRRHRQRPRAQRDVRQVPRVVLAARAGLRLRPPRSRSAQDLLVLPAQGRPRALLGVPSRHVRPGRRRRDPGAVPPSRGLPRRRHRVHPRVR